jgi:hypothetical protein
VSCRGIDESCGCVHRATPKYLVCQDAPQNVATWKSDHRPVRTDTKIGRISHAVNKIYEGTFGGGVFTETVFTKYISMNIFVGYIEILHSIF